jgi:integrase
MQSPKTKNACRQVDLCPALADLLKTFIGDRTSGLVFKNQSGKPLSQTNLVRRSLHPILEEIKVEKTGFHAMRRFRATWLRKQRAPEDLIQFWLGHAKQCVTDGYSKLAEDVEFRAQVAETVGTGFVVPASVRPMRPRKRKEEVAEVAA